jgi:hypothetical protein
MDERFYERGDLTAEALEDELATFFEIAADDTFVRADAERGNISLDTLLAGGTEQIETRPGGPAELTGFEELVVIMLLSPMVNSAWSDVILPWLRRRHKKPLGEETKPDK